MNNPTFKLFMWFMVALVFAIMIASILTDDAKGEELFEVTINVHSRGAYCVGVSRFNEDYTDYTLLDDLRTCGKKKVTYMLPEGSYGFTGFDPQYRLIVYYIPLELIEDTELDMYGVR